MDNTIEDNFENTAIIVSDGCCVQLGNLQVLDDVTSVSYTHLRAHETS